MINSQPSPVVALVASDPHLPVYEREGNSVNSMTIINNDLLPELTRKLIPLLQRQTSLKNEEIESIAHALVDIAESTVKIYEHLLPKLMQAVSQEETQNLIWEIRDEMRHIDYHIHDVEWGYDFLQVHSDPKHFSEGTP